MNGHEIGKILKDAHKSLYGVDEDGATKDVTNAFLGGNVGLVALALSLDKCAKSISRLVDVIEEMNPKKPNV